MKKRDRKELARYVRWVADQMELLDEAWRAARG